MGNGNGIIASTALSSKPHFWAQLICTSECSNLGQTEHLDMKITLQLKPPLTYHQASPAINKRIRKGCSRGQAVELLRYFPPFIFNNNTGKCINSTRNPHTRSLSSKLIFENFGTTDFTSEVVAEFSFCRPWLRLLLLSDTSTQW